MAKPDSLEEVLARHTQEGALYDKLPDNKVHCYACGHNCKIYEGHVGVCRVRANRGGKLYVPHGYVGALQCDPLEKKPFFHAYPGTDALSFGMLGCDYHCAGCQNWEISQTLRDPNAGAPLLECTAQDLVDMAVKRGARVVASTYNEPLITSEWAVEVFAEAKKRGFATAYISNGNGTPRVIEYLRPWVDLYKVDLKAFDEKHYRELGGQFKPVLETIQLLYEKKFWLEIVTLIIPGLNDSEKELRDMAKFIAGISRDIPWHITAFHSDYKMTDTRNTQAAQLIRGCEIGAEEGLRYVYAGNLPGQVGRWENTYCPGCGRAVVQRFGFQITGYSLKQGACPQCSAAIPGVWEEPNLRREGQGFVVPLK